MSEKICERCGGPKAAEKKPSTAYVEHTPEDCEAFAAEQKIQESDPEARCPVSRRKTG